jgi:uncharacterized repeat protein (TIGR03803 family)
MLANRHLRAALAAVIAATAPLATASAGQPNAPTISSVYLFTPTTGGMVQTNANGAGPAGVTFGTDGALYGLVDSGGPTGYGGIFRATTDGQEGLSYVFNQGAAGTFGKLVLGADGYFYGTVGRTTKPDGGAVFQYKPGGTFNRILNFVCTETVQNCNNAGGVKPDDFGYNPSGDLLETTPGTFVGVLDGGGAHGVGSVYSVTSTGQKKLLASFPLASGGYPNGHLVQDAKGVLYGTFAAALTQSTTGGIFSLNHGVIKILHLFNKATEGDAPQAGLLLASDGFLYGTTGFDGPGGYGTLFKANREGKVIVLAAFNNGITGGTPQDALIEGKDGLIYGETPYGGAPGDGYLGGAGVLFRIARDGAGGLQTLYAFKLSSPGFLSRTGAVPNGTLALAPDGTFYGASFNECGFALFGCGAQDNSGAIFSLKP